MIVVVVADWLVCDPKLKNKIIKHTTNYLIGQIANFYFTINFRFQAGN